ncbi:carbon-nitrogen hydrolase family protein [Pseudomonas sp. Gutcm_11s]|uniref:carbon-nitrogen hydrolase family protein n=1 Tax=Pseudomonas sp. Gutcm_11s TaxID=3026088 RepID=UPI00235EB411|nr:carbon-nitrogen hydrolase family protein [Pseudomonas sp. Gutcm_11s]MDD0842620.1 carbon-nitrogen hydrolase family protein [Pseudomonas sp. Gutcm_11s]
MLTLLRRSLYLLLVALLAAYAAWTQWRPTSYFLSDLRSSLAFSQGSDSGRGNLLGIQPDLHAADYRSALHLHRKLAAYLEKARGEGLLNPKTVVVLPEHIGTWLVAAGEKREAFAARDLAEARIWLGLSHPLPLIRAALLSEGKAPLSDALLRMKAEQMADDYQSLFGGLAETYGVTIVAGSIVLPEPSVVDGVLQVGEGPLYNVSLVFGSDGLPLGQPQRKVLPHREEDSFTAGATDQELHVVTTPAGRLGVLIGTDSWRPESYAAMAKQQVELLAVPAFLPGNGQWDSVWPGTPSDLRSRASQLVESEAWLLHSLPAQLANTPARAGMLVFLRGQLWSLGSDGHSMAVTRSGAQLADEATGARLLNLWL